jgi:hypothetical protein
MKKEIKFVDSSIYLKLELTEESKLFVQEADSESFNNAISRMVIDAILNSAGQNLYQNLYLSLKKFIKETEIELQRFSKYLNEPLRKDARYSFDAEEIRKPLPFQNFDLSRNTYEFSYELLSDTSILELDLCKIYFVIKECFEIRNSKKEFTDYITSIFEHNPKLYVLLGGRVQVSDPDSIRRRFDNLSKEIANRISHDSFDPNETLRIIRRKKQQV